MPQALNDIRIVPARNEDVPLVLDFIRKLAEYERLAHECIATEEGLRQWLFGENRAAEVVLASLASTAVGFAVFFPHFSTFAARPGLYLEDLFVDPEARGKGVGKALLRYLADVAVGRGYAWLSWEVLEWNRPAIDFYRSLGAECLDGWRLFRLAGPALKGLAASSAGAPLQNRHTR